MQMGPKTAAKLEEITALSAVFKDTHEAYKRHRAEYDARDREAAALQERLMAGEDILEEWRASCVRCLETDDARGLAYTTHIRTRNALSTLRGQLQAAFHEEHLAALLGPQFGD